MAGSYSQDLSLVEFAASNDFVQRGVVVDYLQVLTSHWLHSNEAVSVSSRS